MSPMVQPPVWAKNRRPRRQLQKALMTSSRPERCDWYSTKTGAWGKWLAISISRSPAFLAQLGRAAALLVRIEHRGAGA